MQDNKDNENYSMLIKNIKKPYSLNMDGISYKMMDHCNDRLNEIKMINFNFNNSERFYNLLSPFCNLERLNASKSRYDVEMKLLDLIKYLPNLKSFKYSFNKVNDSDFFSLCSDLPIMNNLEEIFLSSIIELYILFIDNYITTKAVRILNHYLYKFPNLKYINLSNNKIGSKGVKILLYHYKYRKPSLYFTVTSIIIIIIIYVY